MSTHRITKLLVFASLCSAGYILASPGHALAQDSITTPSGSLSHSNVGTVYSFVHENVPAGTAVLFETVNLANTAATTSHADTVLHVFDRDTNLPVASDDDCSPGYNSCLTIPAGSTVRSFVVYVHAYAAATHGQAELRISHNGTPIMDSDPFDFGGIRITTFVDMPAESYLFTTGFNTTNASPPNGTRLLALQWTENVVALDDNGGLGGFAEFHLPSMLGAYGSVVVGAYGGLVNGSTDTPAVTIHWDTNISYMMPYQKKVEDTAYEILRAAAQAPDGRWFTAFSEAFGGRVDWDEANDIRAQILEGDRFPVALEFVDPTVLSASQALGAYAPNKIFLSSALTNQFTAANVFIEEIAHHFDYAIGGSGDAAGDEGHIFWSFIVGEQLTSAELTELRSANDAGTICVNGQCHAVEFLGLPRWLKRFAGTVWSGIKTTGGWIWSGATTVGGALQTAANQTWNGAQVLGGWIQQGASVAAQKAVESLQRTGNVAVGSIKLAVDSVHDLGLGLYDGAKIMKEGVADIARGNFKDGVTALFVGLAKFSVEAPLSTLTAEVLHEISLIQTLLFLEPMGRSYTPNERAQIDWVFWNNSHWWAGLVKIKEGFSGIWSANSRPFTLKSDIMLKNNGSAISLVVHESTHVWQWWNGGSTYILDSLYYQGLGYLGGAHAYDWQPAVNSGTQWPGLSAEHQAKFVETAYESGCYNFTGTCTINSTPYTSYFVDHVDVHIQNGWGAP